MSCDNFRMPFGKFKDKFLAQIPTSYLKWLSNKPLEGPLEGYVKEQLQQREGVEKCPICNCTLLQKHLTICPYCNAALT